MTSLPPPPTRKSLPEPPKIRSACVEPKTWSLPSPASIRVGRAVKVVRVIVSLPPNVLTSRRARPAPAVMVPPARVTVVAVAVTVSTPSSPRTVRTSNPPAPPSNVTAAPTPV
jgi:hypothetical protein